MDAEFDTCYIICIFACHIHNLLSTHMHMHKNLTVYSCVSNWDTWSSNVGLFSFLAIFCYTLLFLRSNTVLRSPILVCEVE